MLFQDWFVNIFSILLPLNQYLDAQDAQAFVLAQRVPNRVLWLDRRRDSAA
jgi:hypothetical protein